jgi:hypothetical protein
MTRLERTIFIYLEKRRGRKQANSLISPVNRFINVLFEKGLAEKRGMGHQDFNKNNIP